jgi:Peptidase family M1 domain
MRVRPSRAATALTALAVLAACTSTTSGHGSRPSSVPATPTTPATSATTTPSGPTGCGSYAAPDPNRPRMTLQFTIAADHRHVTGHEQVAFTPDLPITELVFRLVANTRPTVAEGNSIQITAASADHGAGHYTFTSANAAAATQGGLLHIPFARRLPAGTTVTASIDFTLTLGSNSFDRFGTTRRFVYFGSGEPLLAWERGFGWHTEPLANFPAESATSEAMDVDLTVTAPARDVVIMSGDPADPPAVGGTRTWHSTISAARDVSVAAGPFVVSDTVVAGVHLRVGAYATIIRDSLVPEFRRAIVQLTARFGPFPFPSLSVARLPAFGGGVEYPSSILMLDGSRLVVVHETAHQWFYAMVGDSQALHPWLDEAFATYAEELVNRDQRPNAGLRSPRPVDASLASYGYDVNGYYFITYTKGADALFAARAAAGPAQFDAAIRCYVATNAWRIANPSDLRAALAGLPSAVSALEQAGALP